MKYETTPRPIRTHEELADASAKGARIEFTACGPTTALREVRPNARPDFYDLVVGWIVMPAEDCYRFLGDNTLPGFLVRAFYPVQP